VPDPFLARPAGHGVRRSYPSDQPRRAEGPPDSASRLLRQVAEEPEASWIDPCRLSLGDRLPLPESLREPFQGVCRQSLGTERQVSPWPPEAQPCGNQNCEHQPLAPTSHA